MDTITVMPLKRWRGAVLLILVAALWVPAVLAENPDWPNGPADDPRDEPPDDPDFWMEWAFFSYIPDAAIGTIRPEEIPLGSGIHADAAWQVTTGDPSVVIAQTDTGIVWDNLDLIEKVLPHRGELPLPEGASDYDANGDGRFNIRDYDGDSRVDDANGNGVIDANDLTRIFADGVDNDGNGYIDDIAGWDFLWDDNDPTDDTKARHGVGVGWWAAAQTNNGVGSAGVCPECMLIPLRVGDDFVGYVNHFNEGLMYGLDNGADILLHANSTINYTSTTRDLINLAWERDIPYVTILGDAASYHHVYPGALERAITVHSFTHDSAQWTNATSYLRLSNCSGFGEKALIGASLDCASLPTGAVAGLVGLVISRARQIGLDPPLSAGEIKQILIVSADDVTIPESLDDPEQYPSTPGWDLHTGYGRANARAAVDLVSPTTIPPEAEIQSPEWFSYVDPFRTETVIVEFNVNARRSASYEYWLEAALGPDPESDEFFRICEDSGLAGPVAGSCPLDLDVFGGDAAATPITPFDFNVTLRLRVKDADGNSAEDRRSFFLHHDDSLIDAFPMLFDASIEANPQAADLDGDGVYELVIATMGGMIDVIDATGASKPGWPKFTGIYPTLDPSDPFGHANAPSLAAGDLEPWREGIWGTPAVGDLEGDGVPDVVVTTMEGSVYAWDASGAAKPGFPVHVDPSNAVPDDPEWFLEEGIMSSPVLEDLAGDGPLEIIVAAMDRHVYVWRADGTPEDGFPVACEDPNGTPPARIIATPAVGDMNGDGLRDIVVGTNEIENRLGRTYAIHGDGSLHAGGPYLEGWPLRIVGFTQNILPYVGQGTVTSPSMTDLDGDGLVEAAVLSGIGVPLAFGADGHPTWLGLTPFYGSESPADFFTGLGGMSFLVWADVNMDGVKDLLTSGLSANYLQLLSRYGVRINWESYLFGLDGATGKQLDYFPMLSEDLMVFNGPAVANIDEDPSPEMLVGSGGFLLHAYDQFGTEPEGWPKFTGHWVSSTPAVADLSGNGYLEVAAGSRDGSLFMWRTCAPADAMPESAGFHHDPRNTGNTMTPLAAQTGPSGADDPYCGTDWHGPGPGDDDDDSDDDDPSDDDASGDDDNDDDDGGCCGC